MSKLYRKNLHLTTSTWITKKVVFSSPVNSMAKSTLICVDPNSGEVGSSLVFQCILEHHKHNLSAVKCPSSQKILSFTVSSFALFSPSVSVFTNPGTPWHATIYILGVSVFPVRIQSYIADFNVLQLYPQAFISCLLRILLMAVNRFPKRYSHFLWLFNNHILQLNCSAYYFSDKIPLIFMLRAQEQKGKKIRKKGWEQWISDSFHIQSPVLLLRHFKTSNWNNVQPYYTD